MDDVELDLEEYVCNEMEKKAVDRTEWASVVRDVKAKLKCCCP